MTWNGATLRCKSVTGRTPPTYGAPPTPARCPGWRWHPSGVGSGEHRRRGWLPTASRHADRVRPYLARTVITALAVLLAVFLVLVVTDALTARALTPGGR